jgi:hypothetical protein
MVVYFLTATNRRSRGALWSIIAPPFIRRIRRLEAPDAQPCKDQRIRDFLAVRQLRPRETHTGTLIA